MAYNHGVKVSEVPTSILPPVRVSAGVTFVVGTALGSDDFAGIHIPVLCYTREEAVKAFGYEEPVLDEETGVKKYKYSLCEVMDTHFKYKQVAPVIMVACALDEKGVDEITSADVIGGVDENGNRTGLELVNECFPRFGIVPGIIIAPGFSSDPAVAAVIAAKAANINEHFSCIGIVDVPTIIGGGGDLPSQVIYYTDAAEWKQENNITDERIICCYPKVSLGGIQFHMSSQLAALMAEVDGQNDDVPYVSPSNHNFAMDSAVLDDGTEVWLSPDQAAYLNSQGVVTALNFMDGWKCWGNRTSKYPGGTDVKDTFIPIRRMFSWIGNTLIQTFWQKVDAPLKRRQIDTIVDSANMWLNGLTAKEYILGGRVEFLDSENPITDLMDGIARFHVYITPPSPNREIDFVLEYDPKYVETLFA